ncbi:hypothetical protein Psuf_092520 [Phytohabitans suffuscus]|uniref:Nucleotidyl transferase domain-containing protein n=1 Tax=Phytohabitans suffuscus TaxID=624315 RepID=A0A6F8Z0W8_9ACTN|nr:sugar phosphate nucleotidyltransferase [Phytohabitans suffuscus]BCB91939.1 hypothetical protein Psuf_092520 [Phytohabitans suffuscus]
MSDAIDTAVILAGGLGTRLGGLAHQVPKALVPSPGARCWHTSSTACAAGRHPGRRGHRTPRRADRGVRRDGGRFGLAVEYLREDTPLGTAGAFGELRDRLPERFLVLYGDVLLDVDLVRMCDFHSGHPGLATLLVHPNDHPADSDLVALGPGGVVTDIVPKNVGRIGWHRNLVNAGVFVLERALLDGVPAGGRRDLERDLLAPAIPHGGCTATAPPSTSRTSAPPRGWSWSGGTPRAGSSPRAACAGRSEPSSWTGTAPSTSTSGWSASRTS